MLKSYLKQTATYWIGETDGYGGYTWSNPKTIKVRWQEKLDRTKNELGEEVVSTGQVWMYEDLPYKSKTIRLYNGETNKNDPRNVNSYEIITRANRVDIDGNTDGYKVWL